MISINTNNQFVRNSQLLINESISKLIEDENNSINNSSNFEFIFQGVNIKILKCELILIIGAPGSGKSLLLKTINQEFKILKEKNKILL